jgi:hypothetical protein
LGAFVGDRFLLSQSRLGSRSFSRRDPRGVALGLVRWLDGMGMGTDLALVWPGVFCPLLSSWRWRRGVFVTWGGFCVVCGAACITTTLTTCDDVGNCVLAASLSVSPLRRQRGRVCLSLARSTAAEARADVGSRSREATTKSAAARANVGSRLRDGNDEVSGGARGRRLLLA